jgi:hypothetical protein
MRFALLILALGLAGCAQESCLTKLQQIESAKNCCWALERGKTTNDTPAWEDLRSYFRNPTPFVCPNGGTYTIGRVGEPPTCSITNDTVKFREIYSKGH